EAREETRERRREAPAPSAVPPSVVEMRATQPSRHEPSARAEAGARAESGAREEEASAAEPAEAAPAAATEAPAAPAAPEAKMEENISVAEIAKQMSVKATDVLKKLWSMGMTGITMNSAIDQDAAGLMAAEFGFEIENVAFQEADIFASGEDAAEDLVARAPV